MRLLFTLLLALTLLLTACGGAANDTNDADDGSSVPAGASDSDSGEDDDVATGAESASASATPTFTRMLVQPTRTPRPTSTPFPTTTPVPLPPTATPHEQDPNATEGAPASVEVLSTNIFRDPDAGSAIIFGEVGNVGDVPATGVEVRAELFDASGDRVGRGEGEAVGKTVMAPGDVAGFSIIITFVDGEYVEWASEELVAGYNFTRPDIIEAYTADLSITDDMLVGPETVFDFVDVTGNLTNNTAAVLHFVQVGAIAYDANGNVISVDSFQTTEPLEPGATITFAVEFSRGRLKELPASYTLVVEGLAEEE